MLGVGLAGHRRGLRQRARRSGRLSEQCRIFLDRRGYLEETFFTFSFSPIRDESGGVVGLFHPVTELTQHSLGERRLRAMRALADRTAELKTVTSSCEAVVAVLTTLDVPFALVYLVEGDEARLVASAGLLPDSPAVPVAVDLVAPEGGGWPIARVVAEREIVEVTDLADRFGPIVGGPYPEPPHSAVVLPIMISGLPYPVAVLVAGVSARRQLDEPYRAFYRMLRDSTANALTTARAYEAERARAEALAVLDRTKTEFFSNISHEFRTPLTLMLGPIAQLRDDPLVAANPRLAEELAVAHRNGLRLKRLVNTVLDFSRLRAGRTSARFEPLELGAVTAELASMFRAATERAGLVLTVECEPLPEPVWVDRDSWEKVVLNLLSNALKFTFAGSVTVTVVAPPDGGALLTVTDTGIGIPESEQGRLFERFHQVAEARGRSAEGSGIGLALADELVALHGGTISVRSRPGVGSTFAVRIPPGCGHLPAEQVARVRSDDAPAPTGPAPAGAAPAGAAPAGPAPAGAAPAGPVPGAAPAGPVPGAAVAGANSASASAEPFVAEALRWLPGAGERPTVAPTAASVVSGSVVDGSVVGAADAVVGAADAVVGAADAGVAGGSGAAPGPATGRVLVADDNADMREYVQRLLSIRYRVTAVADGEAALAAARADPPDLLVSDVMMPGLDGMALLAALRADPATASVPVLLLSARAGPEAAVEGLAAGADDYLAKPFGAAELLARVDAHLRLNRARRETERAEQRYRSARKLLLELQGCLLPEHLPVLPGLRLAAHYLVADADQAAGGDWFDAVPLPDGAVALIVGDVVGHGARASAVMGQLRAVLTACLIEGHDPVATLSRLDRFAARVPGATGATVCLAVLRPSTGRLTYVCRGHPAPLLVTADGPARHLPVPPGGPLDIAGEPAVAAEARLAPEDLVLLYTDGLVERPGESLTTGMERLRRHASDAMALGPSRVEPAVAADRVVDRVCRLSIQGMTRDGHRDDVSLIAAQRCAVAPDLRVELPAVPRSLAALRGTLDGWRAGIGADPREGQEVQVAVGEAVTNAIDHAYPEGPGPVVVLGASRPTVGPVSPSPTRVGGGHRRTTRAIAAGDW
ncbi:MAG: SpoIIE family protein phosphatase [Pseudonocardia sp.]